jgi:hypothetical protein
MVPLLLCIVISDRSVWLDSDVLSLSINRGFGVQTMITLATSVEAVSKPPVGSPNSGSKQKDAAGRINLRPFQLSAGESFLSTAAVVSEGSLFMVEVFQ